jgi:predicted helicase
VDFHKLFSIRYDSWASLEKEIEALTTPNERGAVFEQFVYRYFLLHQDYYQISEVYPEKEIPPNYKEVLKLEKTDYGVDGIFVKKDGTFTAYQAKFRTNRGTPTVRELSTFWTEGEYADYRCIIANCEDLPEVAQKKSGSIQILARDFDKLDSEFFDNLQRMYEGSKPVKPKPAEPDKYQIRMIERIVEGFKTSDRGKLIAACGIGKTLVSLWTVENLESKKILFLAPSLALIKQTLEEWDRHSKTGFSYLCVCSDASVKLEREQDIADFDISEVDFPVTTDSKIILDFLNKDTPLSVVFSTYQSLDAISEAMQGNDFEFDITIFDEAHRTAGTKNSEMFSLGLDNSKIRSKKRLFMTATERIIRPWIKIRAERIKETIFSMDDETIYGKVFDRYTFGEAIEENVISDYKLVITAIDSKEVFNLIEKNRLIQDSGEEEDNITAENLYKQIVLSKAIEELGIKKTITFHSSVKRARNFINGASNVNFQLEDVLKQTTNVQPPDFCFSSVDGTMSAGNRNSILREFENSSLGVVSNARCLTEGIDVPIIDSIYFVDPKSSIVDIVQACGRALRKPRGKQKGDSYFIIPVILDENESIADLDDERFETIHNVIQALRDQDERLADMIDSINIGVASGKGGSSFPTDTIQINLPKKFDLEKFSNAIQLRIATVNGEPTVREKREVIRRSKNVKTFMPFGDYGFDTYLNNLVNPTIEKFKNADIQLTPDEIKVNHNNVSHTVRVKLIEKLESNKYQLTELGKDFKSGKISFEEIFRNSMLNFHSKEVDDLLPYRTIMEVLLIAKKINFIEFLYGLYTIPDSTEESFEEALGIITEIRTKYPNLSILSRPNKEKVLDELNKKYGKEFSYDEAWGSTTSKNKYLYFKNHLDLFDEIKIDGDEIILEEKGHESIKKLIQ